VRVAEGCVLDMGKLCAFSAGWFCLALTACVSARRELDALRVSLKGVYATSAWAFCRVGFGELEEWAITGRETLEISGFEAGSPIPWGKGLIPSPC